MVQLVKNPPALWEIWIRSLGWEDILEKGMATHFSILAWRIPRDRSLAGYSPQGHKELNMTERALKLSVPTTEPIILSPNMLFL